MFGGMFGGGFRRPSGYGYGAPSYGAPGYGAPRRRRRAPAYAPAYRYRSARRRY